ncbi:hypothetical protein DITRI_Ditri15bG0090300 [Diplodiscus trichospermus]
MDPSSNQSIISSEISVDTQPHLPSAKNITHMDVALYKAAARDLAGRSGLGKIFGWLRQALGWSSVQNEKLKFKTSFIEQILNKCPSLLVKPNAEGQTPLHIAAMNGHSDIVKFLINYQAKAPHEDQEKQGTEVQSVREMLRKTDMESNTALM